MEYPNVSSGRQMITPHQHFERDTPKKRSRLPELKARHTYFLCPREIRETQCVSSGEKPAVGRNVAMNDFARLQQFQSRGELASMAPHAVQW
jgi:hypothetical protein